MASNNYIKHLNVKYFTVVIVLLIIAGCFTRQKLSRQNLAFLYNETDIYLRPAFKLFHSDTDTSTLYFNVSTDELLYVREGFLGNFFSEFELNYQLLQSFDAKNIIDSASFHFSDTVVEKKMPFIAGDIKIPIAAGQNYLLRISAKDLNRKTTYLSFIPVEKQNAKSHQNFLVYDENDNIVFDTYFNSKRQLTIYYKGLPSNTLFIKYYNNHFPIATPPFHTSLPKATTIYPDTTYILELTAGKSAPFALNRQGIYRLLIDSSASQGKTLFRFHEDFPAITLPEQMIFSARYLSTRKEFESMTLMADKKQAIEEFWLNIAGNRERARQLIKNYYSRVQAANKFFTSYHEGWKTDRGMIYIIYGAPGTVYKTNESENWIYGEPSNLRSVNFMFYKVENPLTDNDFMLSKSEISRDSWYYAVSNWRR